jgi:hypothetical protein
LIRFQAFPPQVASTSNLLCQVSCLKVSSFVTPWLSATCARSLDLPMAACSDIFA